MPLVVHPTNNDWVNKFVVRTLVLDLSGEALTTNQALLTWRTTSVSLMINLIVWMFILCNRR
jgi:hypothetical protein